MKLVVILTGVLLCGCVEHQGRINVDPLPEKTLAAQIYRNGKPIAANEAVTYQQPLPGEMHLEAWYRDEDGHFFRSQASLLSPRPWWQRFPADLFTDALWPRDLIVEGTTTAQFTKNKRLTKAYLDEMAALHRLDMKQTDTE